MNSYSRSHRRHLPSSFNVALMLSILTYVKKCIHETSLSFIILQHQFTNLKANKMRSIVVYFVDYVVP